MTQTEVHKMSLEKNFSDFLREYRVKNQMSQEDLARKLGTTKQVISNYENGKHTPKISVAANIADVLGVSLEKMLGVDPMPPLEEQLLIYFRAMSDEGKEELVKRASEMLYVYSKKNKKTTNRKAL
jgi:transcriptional regulator with XRE-family HTH domain